ncbi:DUF2497 domain-containing protein [Acetobacter sp.]|uniref:DUF2497 domain-containing protein n=1 Tax=Acetobacter sp. TaxID=440 RepID=UPI0039ECFB48
MASSQDPSEEADKTTGGVTPPAHSAVPDQQGNTELVPDNDEDDDDILLLSPSMMEHEGTDSAQSSLVQPASVAHDDAVLSVTDLRQIELSKKAEKTMSGPLPIPLNDETVSDTANSFVVLQKTLQDKYLREHEERKVAITHEGSLTVEDIVRQEVRVFLKKWLDAHLAGIVQAAVRKEVERLTQRSM